MPNHFNLENSKRQGAGNHPTRTLDGLSDVPISRHHGLRIEDRTNRFRWPLKAFVAGVNLNVREHHGLSLIHI